MKYCKKCGYENLNEQIYCRHCGFEFEYFDWDSVERENTIIDPTKVSNRNWEHNRFKNKRKKSLKVDWLILILSSIIFIPCIIYGLYHSWIIYWILLLVYTCIVAFEIHLIIFLFNIKMTVKIGEHEFYNDRSLGFQTLLTGIMIFCGLYPATFYEKFFAAFILMCPFALLFLLSGIVMLLRPNVFNENNEFTTLNTLTLMWIGGINVFATPMIFSILNQFPLILRLIIITGYVILLFSIMFPDVINKYTKHDIRGKYSSYFLYIHAVPVALALILFFFGQVLRLMI